MLFDMVYVPITCMAALQLNFKTMGPLVPQYAQVTTSLSLSKILEEDFLSHSETASPAMQIMICFYFVASLELVSTRYLIKDSPTLNTGYSLGTTLPVRLLSLNVE